MSNSAQLKILALAPACDGTDVGEAWCAYQWITGLAESNQVTLLTMRKKGRLAPSQQLKNIEVVEWDDLPVVQLLRISGLQNYFCPLPVKFNGSRFANAT